MLGVGERAPAFALPGSAGEDIETYRLSDALAEGPVLLAFYPLDFAPSCTEEVCGLRDTKWFEFMADLRVVGISTDGPFAHRAFADRYDLGFPLLADTDGSVAEAYGVRYGPDADFPGIAKRATFVIDTDGIVGFATVQEDPYEPPDLEAVQQAVAALAE